VQDSTNLKRQIKKSLAWVTLPRQIQNAVLLTFDDGPHPEATPAVLKMLRRHNARAIFFVVGSRIQRAPDILQRILNEGHLIGNHSYTHPNGRQLPFAAYVDDLRRCQDEVKRLTGESPRFFRPPLGVFSLTTMTAPRVLGLEPVLWSLDAYDWGLKNKTDAKIAGERLTRELTANYDLREIVLLHDDHTHMDTVLEPALQSLSARNCDLRSGIEALSSR
jgi:peptidoglycan/xylan/chitin deacetylase (PgdA/CDA1 family)